MNFFKLLISIIILFKYFNIYVALNHTQKASKSTIHKINSLLNQKIKEYDTLFYFIFLTNINYREINKNEAFVQFDDSPSEDFILNEKIKQGKPHFDELRVNDPDK